MMRCLQELLAGIAVWVLIAPVAPKVSFADEPPKLPVPISKQVIAAWEKAGAKPGTIIAKPDGFYLGMAFAYEPTEAWLSPPDFPSEFRFPEEMKKEARTRYRDEVRSALPGFTFSKVSSDTLKTLPPPAVPFGLYLDGRQVNDDTLESMRGLKQLQILRLYITGITNAGLKKLTGFDQLRKLEVYGNCLFTSHRSPLTEQGLGAVSRLRSLEWLNLSESVSSDAGLEKLTALKQLRALDLRGTEITDAGLQKIAPLNQLKWLSIAGTQVTDAGLKHLTAMRHLETLNLEFTNIGDVGLKEISQLKGLQNLDLTDTKITDEGLKALSRLKHLEVLDLCNNSHEGAVSDEGLKMLAQIKELRELNLSGTRVTFNGLKLLRELKALHFLAIWHTNVTKAEAKELVELLPGVQISRD